MTYTIGLIGGTDSSGGSGLGADQKTISDHRCNAISVISAITFQNSSGQVKVHSTPKICFRSQLDSLLEKELDVVKIGMLPDAQAVEEVDRFLQIVRCKKVILDPVKKTSSGYELISNDGWISLVEKLLPKVHLITPNIEEAFALLETGVCSHILPIELAEKCLNLGAKSVLLKGGHIRNDQACIDYLISNNQRYKRFYYKRINGGTNIRGTGCRLASAIACAWAQNNELCKAIKAAGEYIQNYIKESLTAQGFSY